VFSELPDRHVLAAPALHAWEMGNLLHRVRPRSPHGFAGRSDTLAALLEGVALEAPDGDALRRTGALAERHRLSFYDASYLELAGRDRSSRLVSEDRELLAAARAHLGPGRALTIMEIRDALAAERL
jgi:predicted nucleic acid-binding protein